MVESLDVLKLLLKDRTSNKNIVWATDDYQKLGELYRAECEITPELITGKNENVIQPRAAKSQQSQLSRIKDKAEVFTSSWICNAQNNLIDNSWFGRKDVFNFEGDKTWKANKERIIFADRGNKTWKKYVDSPRMEITCGEAPYLVSRYDVVNAGPIPVPERIGFLDRKLRVVNENTFSEEEWRRWAIRAYQSIYGYEYQGDSLLLARENLLLTYVDYLDYRWKKVPCERELSDIAGIISWNIWQMDGVTNTIPYSDKNAAGANQQLSLFDHEKKDARYCIIKDWRAIRWKKKGIIEYRSLLK